MHRLKRLRKSKVIRDLIAQACISPDNLVMPYFVREGQKDKTAHRSDARGFSLFSG